MNIAQRFTFLVKGSITALLDSIEDPERSLNQLILDMQDQLEAAKRAAARAMANEDRLRARIAFHAQDATDWQQAAERSVEKGAETDARDCLRRAEKAERQHDALKRQLDAQVKDTEEIRESVGHLTDRVGQARARLQVLQAKLRQGEARRAINRVLAGVENANLYGEFERLSERVEEDAAAERAYQRIDEEVSGADLKRRVEEAAIDRAVDSRLDDLRKKVESAAAKPAAVAQKEGAQ